ncbi:hypothetical protein VOLCADRAFT_85892 [Volvox carteri f. nagariensis]|uniref:Protein kinase domain-containing protein n=1 Tax=Volvox carteri f. nagariensis TaxID=3068 RepID=D8TH99_VOLCA|nr:uncharacterized protein VOLCADRAFT_85892 [Volvox carteri f. nagariensis]EFJ52673.1 hypothetical protein VOLCADRAFT_85892 [Volvox carteri f. nagariensis]|eukprot:XP_002945678.1 hypothetical protein VOLCADRAFT_85892 [Volvox carteri f. nagariensis]
MTGNPPHDHIHDQVVPREHFCSLDVIVPVASLVHKTKHGVDLLATPQEAGCIHGAGHMLQHGGVQGHQHRALDTHAGLTEGDDVPGAAPGQLHRTHNASDCGFQQVSDHFVLMLHVRRVQCELGQQWFDVVLKHHEQHRPAAWAYCCCKVMPRQNGTTTAAARHRRMAAVARRTQQDPAPSAVPASPLGAQAMIVGRASSGVPHADHLDLVEFFTPQLPFTDNKLLQQLYHSITASPHSITKVLFKEHNSLVFNSPYSSGMPARVVLLMAFQDHVKPLLAKFTLDPADVEHKHKVIRDLLEAAVTGIHVPRPMNAACLLRCGQQIHTTLGLVHQAGNGHNDIKAAKVFLNSQGDCILGDFGSACRLGVVPRESTTTHWLVDIHMTCTAADFFLLAVTLLEHVGVHDLHEFPTTVGLRLAAEQLEGASAEHPMLDTCGLVKSDASRSAKMRRPGLREALATASNMR